MISKNKIINSIIVSSIGLIIAACDGSTKENTESVLQTNSPQSNTGKEILGKVVSIADGDTLTLLDKKNIIYKIRLNCIDAPEKNKILAEVQKQNLIL